MNRRLKFAAVLGLALTSAGAYASGSVSVDAGGTSAAGLDRYDAGKAVYVRKLACASCAYAGVTLTPDVARTILSDRETFGALNADQQEAVRKYFRKRLGVIGE